MRVLFWGSPDFALPPLRALLGSSHEVVGVVTNPDRPAGRGREPRPTPVKEEALARDLPVLQPERPDGPEFHDEVRSLEPDVSAVAAYGQILSGDTLALPPRGSLNVHASLLPELRGAAPINWAVIRGHDRTGVTIMRMVEELDAGPILLQRAVEIAPRETAGDLFGRLAELGGEALVDALDALERGEAEEREQDHDRATYAPKLD
ncbi:MAG: methionyl-tRNA formyltransferase, partial [Gemmatimonadota bacterium]